MVLTMAEGLVTTLQAYLEEHLGTKLAALDAEYDDGIVLEPTVETYVGIKSLDSIPNYPALYLISAESGFIPWGTNHGESRPGVALGIVALDQDAEVLQKRLYRYGRALLEIVLDGMGASSLSGWNLATEEEWKIDTLTAPMTDSSESSFVGEVTVSMRANKVETM